MSEKAAKKSLPPYVPYKTFKNFINSLKKGGVPSHIDKSVMGKMSGSAQSAMMAAIKAMGLINGNAESVSKLKQLVEDPDSYNSVLAEIIPDTYPFLFDGSIDISTATSKLISDKFTQAGASGSTLTKCISFFLASCKDANIIVSPHVKAPPIKRTARKKRTTIVEKPLEQEDTTNDVDDTQYEGMRKFEIPMRDVEDGILYLPEGLEDEDAKKALAFIKFTLKMYYDIDVTD